MKFYDRAIELDLLNKIRKRSERQAQMTVITGRRRIGKTTLIFKAFGNSGMVYFFVAKKSEVLLCQEFTEIIKSQLGVQIYGEISSFRDIFSLLMEYSEKKNLTLVIDEFQEFTNINPSVFSEMQNLWDTRKEKSRMNLILCGSIYSLMKKLFEDAHEPLFGRAGNRLHLKPFSPSTILEIFADHHPDFSADDLLTFYMITGGVPRYAELLTEAGSFSQDYILNEVFSANSFFLEEGKNLLIDEFGKEYGNYFSVLSLIASSKTSRSEIESILEMSAGGYLERLENDFCIISRIKPIFAKEGSRNQKYRIDDPFLRFWFRYIYKNRSSIEIGNLPYVRSLLSQDYETFSGKILEMWFIEKLIAEQKYSHIGTYWDKKNLNEIDIVAINEADKTIMIAEVKRNPDKINLNELTAKAAKLLQNYNDYRVIYTGFSLKEMY